MKKLLVSLALLTAFQASAEVSESLNESKKTVQEVVKQPGSIELAYKNEFAFLEAQRKDLQKRLGKLLRTADKEYELEKSALQGLEEETLISNTQVENYKVLLLDAERETQEAADNQELMQATFMQANSTLEKYGMDLEDDVAFVNLDDAGKVAGLFHQGNIQLEKLSSIHNEPGSFHLTDGIKVDGTLIHFGNVAVYGVSEKGSGVLVPAGEGLLKLSPKSSQETANSLLMGSIPHNLDIFLIENINTAVEEKQEKTALSVVQSGGMIAWIIVAFGIAALLMVLARIVFLKKAGSSTEAVLGAVRPYVENNDIPAALDVCKSYQGASARVLAATVRNLDRDREHLEDIVSESILHESDYLDRFATAILVLAAVSPLMGLLGTVTGMISTFDVITEFGTGDPKMLSGGISEALVTTELGLIVAIPAVLLGNLLSGWAERIKGDMEKVALRVINIAKQNEDAKQEAA